MKKKKLTSLDILDGTVGSSAALSRSEMKNIMAGSGTCSCSYGGCGVAMGQGYNWWSMTVCCDGNCQTYNGSGTYGGTACGGACP